LIKQDIWTYPESISGLQQHFSSVNCSCLLYRAI